MQVLQEQKDALEADLSAINKELDTIRTKKIPELMESMELRNVTIEGIGRVQLAADIYASTREGKKDAAMQWLRDLGYENMIQETYNSSSLKALLRRMLAEGVDIPDDIFNVTPFTRASIVKV
jgi:hypothetical protein